MRRSAEQSAFSLVEMLAVMATILILAGVLLGVGKYITVRASADLTRSELEVLATALQQYYDDLGAFPFDTDTDVPEDGVLDEYLEADLQIDLNGTVTPANSLQEQDGSSPPVIVSTASSSALFYFLDQNPNSRRIVDALMDSLISNKDANGTPIKITLAAGEIDLPRFIDAWGTSIRYEYLPGAAFPVLTSAGPDKQFGTADDIVNP
jgi:type II secretory pathway pseudopilin PulG